MTLVGVYSNIFWICFCGFGWVYEEGKGKGGGGGCKERWVNVRGLEEAAREGG
jgi:hypothetical protein